MKHAVYGHGQFLTLPVSNFKLQISPLAAQQIRNDLRGYLGKFVDDLIGVGELFVGVSRTANTDTGHACGTRGAKTSRRILEDHAPRGVDVEPPCSNEKYFGVWLAAMHIFARHDGLE
jgi:hypothetical protein